MDKQERSVWLTACVVCVITVGHIVSSRTAADLIIGALLVLNMGVVVWLAHILRRQ